MTRLPIHDAGIVTWSGATTMRNQAVVEMQYTLDNNEVTVENYLKSINLDAKGWAKYRVLKDKIEKLNRGKEIHISPYLLK